jgi:hypothetical protein
MKTSRRDFLKGLGLSAVAGGKILKDLAKQQEDVEIEQEIEVEQEDLIDPYFVDFGYFASYPLLYDRGASVWLPNPVKPGKYVAVNKANAADCWECFQCDADEQYSPRCDYCNSPRPRKPYWE